MDLITRRRAIMGYKIAPLYKPIKIVRSAERTNAIPTVLTASGIDYTTKLVLLEKAIGNYNNQIVFDTKNTAVRIRDNSPVMVGYDSALECVIHKDDKYYAVDQGDLVFANMYGTVVLAPNAVTNGANLKTTIETMGQNLEAGMYVVYAAKSIEQWANQDFIVGTFKNGTLTSAGRWNGSSISAYALNSTWGFKIAKDNPIVFYRCDGLY